LFYFLQYLFVLVLSIAEEGTHDLLEQGHVDDLVALTVDEAQGIVEENFKTLFLIV
jgi:hypothetical protein